MEQDIIKSLNDSLGIYEPSDSLLNVYKGYLDGKISKDLLEKSWSSDLKNKHPNGGWRTINGAKVFVSGAGKVIAGLDGFNKEIDKFFDNKKKESGGKKVTLKKPYLRPESILNDFKAGEYNLIKEYNDSYLIEDNSGTRVKLDKNRFESKKEKTPSKDNKETPTIDTFKKIAKESKDVEDFMSKVREVKNVPAEVSKQFMDKYGDDGKRTPREAAVRFMKEHTDIAKESEKREKPTESDKDYFKQNKKEIMDIIDDDPFTSIGDAIKEHKEKNKGGGDYNKDIAQRYVDSGKIPDEMFKLSSEDQKKVREELKKIRSIKEQERASKKTDNDKNWMEFVSRKERQRISEGLQKMSPEELKTLKDKNLKKIDRNFGSERDKKRRLWEQNNDIDILLNAHDKVKKSINTDIMKGLEPDIIKSLGIEDKEPEYTKFEQTLIKGFDMGVYDEDLLEKAMGHKYFKREPKAGGGYKYYYTEAQYKKEKKQGGKSGSDKISTSKVESLGEAAYKEGKMNVPAHSKELMDMLSGRKVGEAPKGEPSSTELMAAFSRGFKNAGDKKKDSGGGKSKFEVGKKYETDSGMGGTLDYKFVGMDGDKLKFKNVMHKDYGGGTTLSLTSEQADNRFKKLAEKETSGDSGKSDNPKLDEKKIAEISEAVENFRKEKNVNYNLKVDNVSNKYHQSFMIEPSSTQDPKYDGMIINYEDGIYEVAEMQAGDDGNLINVFLETKSLKSALNSLDRGNTQKPKKVIDMSGPSKAPNKSREDMNKDKLKGGEPVKLKIPGTENAWVKVSKHSNGYYTQLVYNKGESGGKIDISDTPEKALELAKKQVEKY